VIFWYNGTAWGGVGDVMGWDKNRKKKKNLSLAAMAGWSIDMASVSHTIMLPPPFCGILLLFSILLLLVIALCYVSPYQVNG
jgi:hypothetical protein